MSGRRPAFGPHADGAPGRHRRAPGDGVEAHVRLDDIGRIRSEIRRHGDVRKAGPAQAPDPIEDTAAEAGLQEQIENNAGRMSRV